MRSIIIYGGFLQLDQTQMHYLSILSSMNCAYGHNNIQREEKYDLYAHIFFPIQKLQAWGDRECKGKYCRAETTQESWLAGIF